ncbi:MAG TPA: phage holin family protein [Solirubrobacterales bacterium]|nr:phage holin family protein [Solirubrobacterales bacterium]
MTDGEATQQPAPSAPEPALPPDDAGKPPEEMTVGELVFEVSDRASVLIREEIELAKTEVTEKFNRLLRGSVAGAAAGVFVLLALLMAMHGVAWVLNDLVFDNFWAGFFVEAALFLLIAAGAGLFAWRAFKRGAPPTPDMAIEEAREIKAAFSENGQEDT